MKRTRLQRKTRMKAKRDKPRRTRSELFFGHKRERLHGAARSARRAEIFERAGGRCEEQVIVSWVTTGYTIHGDYGSTPVYEHIPIRERCPNRATEWSHKRHGSNKCDCYSPTAKDACSIASCSDCHRKRHAGGAGKPIAVRKRDIKMEVA